MQSARMAEFVAKMGQEEARRLREVMDADAQWNQQTYPGYPLRGMPAPRPFRVPGRACSTPGGEFEVKVPTRKVVEWVHWVGRTCLETAAGYRRLQDLPTEVLSEAVVQEIRGHRPEYAPAPVRCRIHPGRTLRLHLKPIVGARVEWAATWAQAENLACTMAGQAVVAQDQSLFLRELMILPVNPG